MTVQVTNKDLILFALNVQAYCRNSKLPTKFTKALEKEKKANQAAIDSYYEALEDINLDCASEDDKKNILYENVERGVYAMTKENKKKNTKAAKELGDKKIDVTHKYVLPKDVPHDLSSDFIRVFTPFVLAPEVELEESETDTDEKDNVAIMHPEV